MNYSARLFVGILTAILVYGANADDVWHHSVWARTEPTTSSGTNYKIYKYMTVEDTDEPCDGVTYIVGIPDSGQSDFTATEADHIANYYQVYEGFSKQALVAPASITYNCFAYALGPELVWNQVYDYLGCILDNTFTEVEEIEDADIVVHYGHRYQTDDDMVHASKIIVLFHSHPIGPQNQR